MFAPKQLEFIQNSNAKYNLADGSVRSGKTVGVLFRFMQAAFECPGNQIWMIGHTHETVYHNCVRLLFEPGPLDMFKHFCTWFPGKKQLNFNGKTIHCLGAKDEGAIGPIQGKTFDLVYCNEMTLYPENVLQMIATRLSMPHSRLYGDMNPVNPDHIVKKWIDLASSGDKKYYSLHFTLDDNPFLSQDYKDMLKQTLSGLFYRRNYLGEWCLAEGAIFDFFDKQIHVVKRPPKAAEFFLAGIDVGSSNPFACVILGYSSGRGGQGGPQLWVEKEYFYDPKKMGRQKRLSEFARDLEVFFEGYHPRTVYIDPSAAAFKQELRHMNIHCVDGDNDVYNGIQTMTNLMNEGSLLVMEGCKNLIREIESYTWDPAQSLRGEDAPIKKDDHVLDATRYVCHTFLKGRKSLKSGIDTPESAKNLGRAFDTMNPFANQNDYQQRFMS